MRKKIYKLLGLELGSLKEESGNDWVRAEKEILEEEKKELFLNQKHKKDLDYNMVMSSPIKKYLCEKIEISTNKDLITKEIEYLFSSNDKDVILNLIRNDYLTQEMKEKVFKNGTFLCKELLKDQICYTKN